MKIIENGISAKMTAAAKAARKRRKAKGGESGGWLAWRAKSESQRISGIMA